MYSEVTPYSQSDQTVGLYLFAIETNGTTLTEQIILVRKTIQITCNKYDPQGGLFSIVKDTNSLVQRTTEQVHPRDQGSIFGHNTIIF